MKAENVADIEITGKIKPEYDKILTPEAVEFIAILHAKFNGTRKKLLAEREIIQRAINAGNFPSFRDETKDIREGDWQISGVPDDLQDRRTEITGPTNRKMVINALNSGAKVFMADFEDANSPSWENTLDGQVNLYDANRNQIDFTAENGKSYKLNESHATLKVRARGWHLDEKHVLIHGEPVSASIFDFGLYFFHNAKYLLENGSGPYFYLPKLENHREARLWNDVFIEAQDLLGIPQGSIKVTVLIETITAAFEMEEIIYELRNHLVALNAGRWDYIFSVIKKFRNFKSFVLPDRSQVTMGVPFMKAYAMQVVKACHKRGAHAIGGMSAFIPSKSEEANKKAFEKVKADKSTEASQGYDGTWVAHPFLVPVAIEEFNKALGDKPHQKHVLHEDYELSGEELIDVKIPGGTITEAGVRTNINVGILYIESWLHGVGAAALYDLMEDAATAEISRAQVWQWLHVDSAKLDDGRHLDMNLYKKLLSEEVEKCKELLGEERLSTGNLDKAVELFDELVTNSNFKEFLTLDAYKILKG
ncbi:malate synthase A [Marinigracilibium pacificum]|uniref:malate synthase n=1 Tax=Marinigracilibium pacificum TaxID=2729599 RepID=A0A848ISX8_9BACT|nr:malate synthase A [Marinigracilibium pacificum]NMM47563.1 malate synthase A [Marinigracilibium pacificum]